MSIRPVRMSAFAGWLTLLGLGLLAAVAPVVAENAYQVCKAGTSDCSNEETVQFGGSRR